MPRPSQHTDRRLITAARALIEETGCSGLNLRQVAERAKVNLGMFHYHFGSKDEFCRRVLDEIYEAFFKEFRLEAAAHAAPVENLHAVLVVFGRFVRDNRRLLFALVRDAMGGEPAVQAFLQTNIPRHLRIIAGLVRQAQRDGSLARMRVTNAVVLLMSGVAMPAFLAEGVRRSTVRGSRPLTLLLETQTLSDAAIGQRVAATIAGLKAPRAGRRKGA